MRALRDLATALSLGNLCFFGFWSETLSSPNYYHMMAPPSPSEIVALMTNVVLLATLSWGGITLARRSGLSTALHLARWVFLTVFLIIVYNFYWYILRAYKVSDFFPFELVGFLPGAFAFLYAAAVVFMLVRWRNRVISIAATIVLVFSPFVLVTFARAGWFLLQYESLRGEFAYKALVPPLPVESKPAPRVLWLVFDELDYRLTFLERPSSVNFSEIDRFRSQALWASNAYPPAGNTMLSIPALLSGRLVAAAQPIDVDDLRVTFADDARPVNWRTQSNVFSSARQLGLNTAVVGWYHPYCRIVRESLTACTFHGGVRGKPGLTIPEAAAHQIAGLLRALPSAGGFRAEQYFRRLTGNHYEKRRRFLEIQRYLDMSQHAKEVVTNPDISLALLHWSIPHPYGIYDRSKKEFAQKGYTSYLDNLELVDHTLGELRRSMEQAGTWDKTTIVIASDHPYRTHMWKTDAASEDSKAVGGKIDHRVPFLLKLAGWEQEIMYTPAFNTVLTHDLILGLLKGEITDPDSLVVWIDQHRSIGQSPYYKTN